MAFWQNEGIIYLPNTMVLARPLGAVHGRKSREPMGAHGGKEAPMLRITFTIEVNLERLRALTAFLG